MARTTRGADAPESAVDPVADAAPEVAAPKRRSTRKAVAAPVVELASPEPIVDSMVNEPIAVESATVEETAAEAVVAEAPAPKRRRKSPAAAEAAPTTDDAVGAALVVPDPPAVIEESLVAEAVAEPVVEAVATAAAASEVVASAVAASEAVPIEAAPVETAVATPARRPRRKAAEAAAELAAEPTASAPVMSAEPAPADPADSIERADRSDPSDSAGDDQLITSLDNDRVKYVRALHEKRIRDREGAFLIEGIRLVEEALGAGVDVPLALFDPVALRGNNRARQIIDALGEAAVPVTDRVLRSVADTVTPQGVVAVVKVPEPADPYPNGRIVLVLDAIQDPGNLGTILRTANAAGVQTVVCSNDCVDVYSPKVVRAGMGAHFHLDLFVEREWGQVERLVARRQLLVGTSVGGRPYFQVDWSKPTALVISNEASGPSHAALRLANVQGNGKVSIPMSGPADSLNAAVAAGILLFESGRQSSAARSQQPRGREQGGRPPFRPSGDRGYDRGGPPDRGGYDRGGYDRGDRGGYDRGNFDRSGPDRGGYDRGFDRGGPPDRGDYDRGPDRDDRPPRGPRPPFRGGPPPNRGGGGGGGGRPDGPRGGGAGGGGGNWGGPNRGGPPNRGGGGPSRSGPPSRGGRPFGGPSNRDRR